MLDARQIDSYRKMTPEERFAVWFELAELGMAMWEANLDEAEIDRRMEIWRKEHDLSDAEMLRGFRAAAQRDTA